MSTVEPRVQAQIDQILARVHEGGRIDYDEGLLLYQHADMLDVECELARRLDAAEEEALARDVHVIDSDPLRVALLALGRTVAGSRR